MRQLGVREVAIQPFEKKKRGARAVSLGECTPRLAGEGGGGATLYTRNIHKDLRSQRCGGNAFVKSARTTITITERAGGRKDAGAGGRPLLA